MDKDRNFWSPCCCKGYKPRQLLLKSPHTDLLELIHSKIEPWGSSSKGTTDIGEEWIVCNEGKRWKGSILPHRSAGRGHFSFAEPSPYRDGKQVPYLSFYQPNIVSSNIVIPWDPKPLNFRTHLSSFHYLFYSNGLSELMLQTCLKSVKLSSSSFGMAYISC